MFVVMIPARLDSSRLSRKPLRKIGDKTLLEITVASALKTDTEAVVVLTPDQEVADLCDEKNIKCVFSDFEGVESGTQRCAISVDSVSAIIGKKFGVIVNWQVDEPLVDPQWVNQLFLSTMATGNIHTIITKLPPTMMCDRNSVKAIYSFDTCHWFSRSYFPYSAYHVGVYAFPKHVLKRIGLRSPAQEGSLSRIEKLEQLHWLELGFKINCHRYDVDPPVSVNTPYDLDLLRELIEGKQEGGRCI